MNALHDKTVDGSIFSSQSADSVAAQRHRTSTFAVPTRRADIERRTLLRTITAASGTALSFALLSRRAAGNPLIRAHRLLPIALRRQRSRPVTTQSSLGATEKDPRCSWCMGFLEPA